MLKWQSPFFLSYSKSGKARKEGIISHKQIKLYMHSQKDSGNIAILAFSAFSAKKHKKSENSNYISSNYYNTCKLLTTKEAKKRKLREEEEEEGRGL